LAPHPRRRHFSDFGYISYKRYALGEHPKLILSVPVIKPPGREAGHPSPSGVEAQNEGYITTLLHTPSCS
jgi:hypothetical protein